MDVLAFAVCILSLIGCILILAAYRHFLIRLLAAIGGTYAALIAVLFLSYWA